MKISNLILISNYLILLSWGLILNVLGMEESLAGVFFSLGFGLYTTIFPLIVIYYCVNKDFCFPIALVFLSVFIFGIGTLIWFYYDFVLEKMLRFPSMPDLIYFFRGQPLLYAILSLFSGRKYAWNKFLFTLIFYISLVLISIFYTSIFLGSKVVPSMFQLYFPLETFSFLIFLVFLVGDIFTTHRRFMYSVKNLIIATFGYFILLVADCAFFYIDLTTGFVPSSINDLLFLTGYFIFMYGFTNLKDLGDTAGFIDTKKGIYYQQITMYRPTSLN